MKKVIIAKTEHEGRNPGDFVFKPMDAAELEVIFSSAMTKGSGRVAIRYLAFEAEL